VMLQWKREQKATRRNWWEILAGHKDATPRVAEVPRFPYYVPRASDRDFRLTWPGSFAGIQTNKLHRFVSRPVGDQNGNVAAREWDTRAIKRSHPSFSATPRIVTLYRSLGFTLQFLDAPRRISCMATGCGPGSVGYEKSVKRTTTEKALTRFVGVAICSYTSRHDVHWHS
jgi:hypothetical protein